MSDIPRQPRPWWVTLLCVFVALAGIVGPILVLATATDSPLRPLMWAFPAYTAATAVCAWICWNQRKEVSWILIAVAVLATAAISAAATLQPTALYTAM